MNERTSWLYAFPISLVIKCLASSFSFFHILIEISCIVYKQILYFTLYNVSLIQQDFLFFIYWHEKCRQNNNLKKGVTECCKWLEEFLCYFINLIGRTLKIIFFILKHFIYSSGFSLPFIKFSELAMWSESLWLKDTNHNRHYSFFFKQFWVISLGYWLNKL